MNIYTFKHIFTYICIYTRKKENRREAISEEITAEIFPESKKDMNT